MHHSDSRITRKEARERSRKRFVPESNCHCQLSTRIEHLRYQFSPNEAAVKPKFAPGAIASIFRDFPPEPRGLYTIVAVERNHGFPGKAKGQESRGNFSSFRRRATGFLPEHSKGRLEWTKVRWLPRRGLFIKEQETR